MTFSLSAKGEKWCRNCGSTTDLQLHHIIPKSKFKAGRSEIRNGMTLCQACHAGWHQAKKVLYRDLFSEDEWAYLTSVELTGENIDAWLDRNYPEPPAPSPVTSHSHESPGPAGRQKCPTCLRLLPKEQEKELDAPRVRKTWAVAVPVDEQENGAEVLDGLLEACRDLFCHDESKKVRYFTLVQALALVVQNGGRMVSDG